MVNIQGSSGRGHSKVKLGILEERLLAFQWTDSRGHCEVAFSLRKRSAGFVRDLIFTEKNKNKKQVLSRNTLFISCVQKVAAKSSTLPG